MLALTLHPAAWFGIVLGGLWVLGRVGNRLNPASTLRRKEDAPAGFVTIAGCDEAVADLREMVEFIKDPERFSRLGARTPRGALLVGPPGTGKTMLARAVAHEAGVEFINANGSDFVEMYVGVGAQRIRDLYRRARESKRAIVFIDEVDALARSRSMENSQVSSGAQTEHENTLIALLTEIDGFADGSSVVTIAATNRPDIIDPALTRPGRLERRIAVPNPDHAGRVEILRVHTRNKPLAGSVDLVRIADRTAGMSGADLERVTNEAAIAAAHRGAEEIAQEALEDAVEYVTMGRPRHSRVVTERDRRITAWHEAGHTVAALLLPHAQRPVSVSIVPRGAAGGVTWLSSSDNQYLTLDEARDRLAVMLGGRAAEEIHLGGGCTQGASSDLAHATALARELVTRYGMAGTSLQTKIKDDATTTAAIDALLDEAHERVAALLGENALLLERIATSLLREGTLDSTALGAITAGVPRAVAPPHQIVRSAPLTAAPAPRRTPVRRLPRRLAGHVLGRIRTRTRHA